MSPARPRRTFQTLESRTLMAADLGPALEAPTVQSGPDDWFIADSFSFGVEREMKESGEKGGTTDINIGVGELQEAAYDEALASSGADREPYLTYKLSRCFAQSWNTSGDADDRPTEEVAFYYSKG